MKTSGSPVVKDLVLVGGGHSHVEVLRRFGMRPLAGVRLTLVCRESHTPYSGMLPGHVAGHYAFDEAHIDLGPLSRFAGARFYQSTVTALDLSGRRVICNNRPAVSFDLLSVNTGSTPGTARVPGAYETVLPIKPIDAFLGRWNEIATQAQRCEKPFRLGVVGGGAGGVEILLSIQQRLNNLLSGRKADAAIEYHLFHTQMEILPTHCPAVRRRFVTTLHSRGVILHLGEPVVHVSPGKLQTLNGLVHDCDQIIWATDAAAPPWPGEAGLEVDDQGFIRVTDRLQSTSHPDVFAAGDIASIVGHPRPKSGVYAVRQGKWLARNLRRALLGQTLKPYRPQTQSLNLISTGDKVAVASRGRWSVAGSRMWLLKDRIDRRFMDKYNKLPDMPDPREDYGDIPVADAATRAEIGQNSMRCGGCGAKIGAPVLDRILGSLNSPARSDVLIGIGDPDDAAVVETAPGALTVHTVDSFRALFDDPYLFGKVTANHCLGDIYAMGGVPVTALAVATIPFGPETKIADELSQLMTGATETLNAAGCSLIGGHTGEGAELSLGFAINGRVEQGRILRKNGLRPGDCLIMTKPIGSGALFAANMRGKARRRWIDAALVHLTRSSREASACLLRHGASAATDVTGFGLLGHLYELAHASGVTAVIDIHAVPVMDGAEDTVRAGYLSSLQSQNMRLESSVAGAGRHGHLPRYQLLFDPQTAGGLLAGIPQDRVEACLTDLRSAGDMEAAIIGTIEPARDPPVHITLQP